MAALRTLAAAAVGTTVGYLTAATVAAIVRGRIADDRDRAYAEGWEAGWGVGARVTADELAEQPPTAGAAWGAVL